MKNLKAKLLASVAMLLVSTIMLTSASFAWFTISTAPEIKGIETQVVVNDNLEIALAKSADTNGVVPLPEASATGDTGKAYTWGNILDLSAATDLVANKSYENLNKTLRPATLIAAEGENLGKFQYPTYGTDGRPNALTNLTEGTMANGFGNLTGEHNHVYGYYIDFWVRSNKAGTVTLSVAADRGNGEMGGGSVFSFGTTGTATDAEKVLAENIRIAFKDLSTDTTATRVNQVATAATATPEKTTGANPTSTGNATFTGDVVTLKANEAKLVRMYVYLEGANVTNAAASLSADDGGVAAVTVDGTLNIQFAMTGIDTPMDVKAPEAT